MEGLRKITALSTRQKLAKGCRAFASAHLSPETRWRYLLLAFIIIFFSILKLNLTIGLGRPCLDGDYYYQIARNVAEGNGLATNLSLYNQGLKSFPHKINHAPIWPLTMGFFGKFFELEDVALILPEIIYLLDLILLYFLTNRLIRRAETAPKRFFIFNTRFADLGHLMVVVFGSNRILFEFTSLPYTEALSFFFVFLVFLIADRAAEKRNLRLAAIAGFLATLAFLTRTQMIGAVLAVPFVFGIIGLRDRKFLVMAVVCSLASGLAFLPWVCWVASWADVKGWQTFVGMGNIYETPELKYFRSGVVSKNSTQTLETIKQGLIVAFTPGKKNSYLFSFGWAVYLVPLALAELVADWSKIKSVFKRFISAEGCLVLIMVIAAIISLSPLHIEKKRFFKPWLFGWRHGLPFIMLLTISVAFLMSSKDKLVKVIVIVLCALSIAGGFEDIKKLYSRRWNPGLYSLERQVVDWLDSQDPKPTVITDHSQILAAHSRSYFHWINCEVSGNHTLALFEKAGADYLLVYPRTKRCRFFKTVKNKLKLVKRFKKRKTMELWALRSP